MPVRGAFLRQSPKPMRSSAPHERIAGLAGLMRCRARVTAWPRGCSRQTGMRAGFVERGKRPRLVLLDGF